MLLSRFIYICHFGNLIRIIHIIFDLPNILKSYVIPFLFSYLIDLLRMSNQNNDLNKNDDQEDQNYEDDNIEVIELNYDGEEDDVCNSLSQFEALRRDKNSPAREEIKF